MVVVNWNGMPHLAECVESLGAQSYPRIETVLVDNGSTDGSRQWLRTCALPGVRLVELDRNTGFAPGANAGIRASSGEFVALLNNDAVAQPDWIGALVEAMTDPAAGMAASKILFHDRPDTIDKAGHLFYLDGLNRGRGAGEEDRGQFDAETEVLFPDGCAALYRREMLDDVGLFDEQFFAYGDDADLGLRARWKGWKCVYVPRARVYHRHSTTLGKYSPRKAFLVERNRFWVAVKLLPWPLLAVSPILTAWRFVWHAASVLLRRGLAGGVRRDHGARGLAAATVRAYASGVRGIVPILRKRREVFRTRRLGSRAFLRLLWKNRISARELAMRD